MKCAAGGHLPAATVAGRILLSLVLVRVSAQDSSLEAGGSAPTTRLCLRNNECNRAAGEVCWWYFAGCPRGQCMCDPRARYRDPNGRCRTMKIGNEPCTQNDKCPDGMLCARGRCQCNSGTMTKDHAFCLKFNERLLGETCNPKRDICYQTSARSYSPTEVICSEYAECSCREGYRETGNSCVRWNIGERGCLKNYHCQGGALCIDGFCQCPAGYEPGAGNSKCVRQGATFDLVLTACDEINENKYCAKDYVCHRCAGRQNYTCVKFKEAQLRRYVSAGSRLYAYSSIQLITAFHVLIAVSLSIWKNR